MRKGVVPVSIIASALVVWSITRDQSTVHVPAAVAPVVVTLEGGANAATEDARAVVGPEVSAASRNSRVAPMVPATRHLYQEPEFGDRLMAYLWASGLSEIDARRIADEAVSGLIECADASRLSPGLQPSCQQNVLQQTGLNDTVLRAAVIDGGSNMARRRALEASAEVRARQSSR